MSRVLDVYLKERKVGELKQDEDASLTFTFDSNYLADNPVTLSVSLPVKEEPFINRIARSFFSGLLLMNARDAVWPQRSAYPRATPCRSSS